jgi:hypothetical protein
VIPVPLNTEFPPIVPLPVPEEIAPPAPTVIVYVVPIYK